MKSQVVFRTIREQIVQRLRNEVLAGQFGQGEPLREAKLAERFGVSRGPIRDALLQLTQEGLLTGQPNVGVKVSPAPSDAIRPLVVELRKQIEGYALAAIFDEITPEDLARWDQILAGIKSACAAGDLPTLVEHDMAFHRSIIERTGDLDLLAIWLPIVVRMMLHYSRHTDLMQCYAEHERVVKAIKAGKKQQAVKALIANIW
jgi:GntR family transcriptional regulator, rspAB operon transcriptional repressor